MEQEIPEVLTGTHTPECIAAFVQFKKDRAEFASKWPKFCRTCSATGAVGWPVRDGPEEPAPDPDLWVPR